MIRLKNGMTADETGFKVSEYSYNTCYNFHDFQIPRRQIHAYIEQVSKTIPLDYFYIAGNYGDKIRVWVYETPSERHEGDVKKFLWNSLDGRSHDFFSNDIANFLWDTSIHNWSVGENHDHIIITTYKNISEELKKANFYPHFAVYNYTKGKYSKKEYITKLYFAPNDKLKRFFKLKTIENKNWYLEDEVYS